MKLLVALALLFPLTASADAPLTKQELEEALAKVKPGEEAEVRPGMYMAMHRQQVKSPIRGGWHLAKSSKGGFSVEVPLPFNDLSMRAAATDGVAVRVDEIGAQSPGLISWSAVCMHRQDGKRGPKDDVEWADKTEAMGSPVRGYQRAVPAGARMCTLVVEAKGTDPLPSDAEIKRFLRSFKVTGKVTWPKTRRATSDVR